LKKGEFISQGKITREINQLKHKTATMTKICITYMNVCFCAVRSCQMMATEEQCK